MLSMQQVSGARRRISKVGDRFLALFLMWRLRKEPTYGYLLVNEIRDLGLGPSRQSTVYAILPRLEKLGFVSSQNELVGKRIRKIYRTTAKGAELFDKVKKARMKGRLREFLGALLS